MVATYKYDVFGAVRSSTGAGSTEYRFTGQQNDATVGYTYLRARYYDPATGRFVSKDPFPGVLTNPASLHYYTYAENSSTNLVDPSGETGAYPEWRPQGLFAECGGGRPPVQPPGTGFGGDAIAEAIAVGAGALVAASWGNIQAAREACGEAIQRTIDNASIFFAQREKGMLDQIGRERQLTDDQRQRLGRAVEDRKHYVGRPNSDKITKREIEKIADEEGLDNRQ